MILFFEGFETCGTETGLANQAITRPRVHARWSDTASGGIPATDSYYLIDDPFSEGFALNIGTDSFSTSNGLFLEIPEDRLDAPGAASREWVVGFRTHIPNTPVENYDLLVVNGLFGVASPTSVIFLSVVNSVDLVLTRANPGQATIGTATGGLTPGAWHYIELKFKIAEAAFVNRIETFTGSVVSGNYTLSITIPSLGVSEFTTANIAYNATASTIASAIDTASPPEVAVGFINVSDSESAGLSDGYIELTADDNLEFTVVIENVDLSGGDVGAVVAAEGGYAEVRIDGTEVINEHAYDTNNALTTAFNELEFGNAGVGAGGENFVGYDDFYVMDCSESPHQDFLGPVRVRSIPPNADSFQDWENETTGPQNYTHVDENGADDSDYVETDVNGDIDRYGVTNPTEIDQVIAVKVEAEVINATGGSPSIFLQVVSGATVEEQEHVITTTAAYQLVDMYVQDDPAGGSWTESSINAVLAGMSFQNNVS